MTFSRRSVNERIALLGLRSDANQFLAPDGAMSAALNVWLARPGLIQKRRGFGRFSNSLLSNINKMFPYETNFITHVGDGALMPYSMRKVSSVGAVTTYSGTYPPPIDMNGAANWKMRGCIANKNFLFTTANGVYRLSGSGSTPVLAGGCIALSLQAALAANGSGFLAIGFRCAYRYEIGQVDNFGNEIVGPVSGRATVDNSSGSADNVIVTIRLPASATVNNFVRLYRSAQVPIGQVPDDDCQLVYEAQITAAQIASGTIILQGPTMDLVPDGLRGAFIYTSPNAGEGILQNNSVPPVAAEIAVHKNRAWYANTQQPSTFELQVLSVGGSSGIQDGDVMTFSGPSPLSIRAKSSVLVGTDYLLITSGTSSYNIEQTTLNLVDCINKNGAPNQIYAQYVSGPNDVPGKFIVISNGPLTINGFTCVVQQGSKRDCFSPHLTPNDGTFNLSRTSNVVTATAASGNQSFEVGEAVSVQAGGSFGAGPFTITAVTSNTFTYSETGVNATLSSRNVGLVTKNIASSTIDIRPNRLFYSKELQPEAVPLLNYIDIGRPDASIIAIVSADDQLWIFKRDGIFRLVGVDEATFQVVAVDLTVQCNAREMTGAFQGQPFAMTQKGLMVASASGLRNLGWQINKTLLDLFVGTPGTNLESLGYAVPYDSEDMLLVFFGDNRDKASGSIAACNGGFVFNGKAQEWTQWAFDNSNRSGNGKTFGLWNPADDRLYFADRYDTGNSNTFIYQENKARTVADLVDQYGDASSNAITSVVAPVLITQNSPGVDKLFKEVALLFNGNQPSGFTVTDGNEWGSGGTHTIAPSSGYVARLWPFLAASRGSVLTLNIQHANPSEAFDLAGIQIQYETIGTVVGR